MAEIDEAAAVRIAVEWTSTVPLYRLDGFEIVNLARAALAWKARAEAAEAERDKLEVRADSLEAQLERLSDPCPDCGPPMTVDEVGEFDDGSMRCEVCYLHGRVRYAEAERDSLKRQLAQSVKAR